MAPNGDTLIVNSQSLVLNGEPWLPVAGEFHYSRYPADQWLPELLKMKAAGVDIVSTYVIWIHHEEVQDRLVFSGSRNITRFIDTAGIAPPIQLCGQAGGAIEPTDAVIETAQGLWTIKIPWSEIVDVDAWLMIDYEGDLARLYAGSLLIDDHFYNGETWTVGLKRFASRARNSTLTLAIMPLRKDAPIYLQTKPAFASNGQACAVSNITISTVYRLEIVIL